MRGEIMGTAGGAILDFRDVITIYMKVSRINLN